MCYMIAACGEPELPAKGFCYANLPSFRFAGVVKIGKA